MIPLRLTVKNFMCYRDNVPALDLEPIHVACLCGDNGHGKTALLDAITWALWGQARSRTQDELVHQGQTDMAVELDFLARGQRYRVSRRHARSARSRQGTTLLELQVASDDGFRPITGNTVRETETRIRETLHMEYETFINTAFLRQGDADRFTTSRPAERKETLAEVLDLSYYRRLEERARDKSRSIQDDLLAVERDIALRREEAARKPEHEEGLRNTQAALAQLQPEVDAQRLKTEELRRTVDTLTVKSKELISLAERLADTQKDTAHLQDQVRDHETRVTGFLSAVEKEAEIREGFAGLQECRSELERLDRALAAKGELDRARAPLEREVAVQGERLQVQAGNLRTRITGELEPRASRLPEIEEGLRKNEQGRAELLGLEETVHREREKAQQVASRSRDLELINDHLKREMDDTRKKFDMLEQGDKTCPLCNQPLGAEGQAHLRDEYENQGRERRRQYDENTAEIKGLTASHKKLTAQLAQLEARLTQGRQRVERTAATLERDRADSEKAAVELKSATAELTGIEEQLQSEKFAVEEREQIAGLDSELAALGYDAAQHDQTRRQGKELERFDELNRKLQEAIEELPVARESMETAQQMLQRRQAEAAESQERKAVLEGELEGLPSAESRLKEAQASFQDLDRQHQEALVRQGVLQNAIERCEQAEGELRRSEKRHAGLVDDKSVYDELAVAFGKNGIQALIIETAIPQLQDDASELLSRLTENQMHLKLQLLEGRKDSRTGMPSEELDIKISYDGSSRNYETFSGGEAFRINFALRIALSKLLARRSGAPLPTLFIDEGFGSQDATGQERLIQAIQSIQDDFQKIIVITHIEQVKESFPVRIEVTKTGSGSTFVVA